MSRNLSLDLLRIMAMFMILVLHSIVFMDMSDISFPKCLLYDTEIALCRSGVNVFVLLTGYFLCKENQNFRKIYTLVASILFFNVILLSIKQILLGGVTLHTLITCLSPFKYWFINCYIGLMLLAPYIIIAIKDMSHKTFDMLVLILTLTNVLFGRFIGTADGFSLLWFINLFMIGQRLKRTSIQYSQKKIILLLIASITIHVIGSFILLNNIEILDSYNVGISGVYSNIFCLTTSVCFFLLFKQSSLTAHSKNISFFALSAFAVYLISENFIIKPEIWKIWNSLLKYTNASNNIMAFLSIQLAFCSLLFIVCVIIDRLRLFVFNLINIDRFIYRLDLQTNKLLNYIVNKI